MEPVRVIRKDEAETGWEFIVEVGENSDIIGYRVRVDREYWEKLTNEKRKPEELVRSSFLFLLQKEAKTSILKSFNLHEISYYFPEYEDEMKRKMRSA